MKKIFNKILRGASVLALASLPTMIFAQKAGDVISGIVEDSEGPVMMANVVEMDETGRIVAHAVTDINGEFSFRLQNPKNKLTITYVGYETVELPFNKTYFEIKMSDITEIQEVVIKAERVAGGSGLAIPEREISAAQQTIDMSEFEDMGITSIDEAIQGRFSGLDIVFDSGDLGSRSTMHMRGVSTLTGDANPLIVVDGNIWQIEANKMNNFDFTNDMNNGEKMSELLSVNPEDIASITVLKDAAATAIWGVQGSNGVIEIKTKRGSRGKTRLSYSYRLNGTWQPDGYRLMTGDEYTMFLKEAFFNPQLSDGAANLRELNYDPSFSEYEMYNNNTDWVSAVKQFGVQQAHSVAVSGGGEKANFRISAGYDTQEGSIIGQHMNRLTTRVNFDYFISDRIKVSTNYAMTYTKNKTNRTALSQAMQMMPNLSIYYQDREGKSTGQYYTMLASAPEQLPHMQNPVAVAELNKQYNTSMSVQPEFVMTYNIMGLEPGQHRLTYDGRVTFQVQNSGDDNYMPAELIADGWTSTQANSISTSSNKSSNVTTTHTLTFVPSFENHNHSVMAMVRGQVGANNSKNQSQSIYGVPSGSFESTALDGVIENFTTGAGRGRSANATFSGHYAFKSKYIFDLTVRADGTTSMGDKRRWGVFPALSMRWNISDEAFMQALPWITMLSIRPSWGITGNPPGGSDLYYSKYSSYDAYLGTSSIRPSNIRLSKLQWEETMSWNLGFDIGLFADKISANIDLYTRTTTKQLQNNYAIPTSSGFSSLSYVNDGSMRNQGWELTLNTNRLITFGDVSVNTNLSFSDNSNQILEMNPIMLERRNGDFEYKNGQYLSYIQLRNSFGSIYGFKYKGVYQYSDYTEEEVPGVSGPNAPVVKDADGNVILNQKGKTKPMMFAYGETAEYEFVGGDAIYEDINSDGNINELDIVYLGSSLPKMSGGFGFRINYKRFSWNNQFSFRWGNKIVNQARMNAESMYETKNSSAAVNWRWRVEGDKTIMPRALYHHGYNYLGSDRYVENGSFLRWNQCVLSYNIDPKFVKNLGISGISLNCSMSNLLVFTKYSGMDPEVGYGGMGVATDGAQTPRSKSFTCGLSVSF